MEFFSSREYRELNGRLEAAQAELAEYHALDPYLALAQQMRDQLIEEVETTPEGQRAVRERAFELASTAERNRIIEEYAKDKKVELTARQTEVIKNEVIASEGERIEKEVAESVSKQEPAVRKRVEQDIEKELKNLKQTELLEQIKTDESKKVLEKLGAMAVEKAAYETMIAELKQKAENHLYIDIANLPLDCVLKIGLSSKPLQSRYNDPMPYCERTMTLRVFDPQKGLLEVMDDSWMDDKDCVRNELAIEDLTLIQLLPSSPKKPQFRFNKDVEPYFALEDNSLINMFGHELRAVSIADQIILK